MLFHLHSLFHLPEKNCTSIKLSFECQTFSPCSSLVGNRRIRARTGWGTKPSKSGSSPHTSTTSHWGETPPRWQKELSTCKNHLMEQVYEGGDKNLWVGLQGSPPLYTLLTSSHVCKRCPAYQNPTSSMTRAGQWPPWFASPLCIPPYTSSNYMLHCRSDAYI